MIRKVNHILILVLFFLILFSQVAVSQFALKLVDFPNYSCRDVVFDGANFVCLVSTTNTALNHDAKLIFLSQTGEILGSEDLVLNPMYGLDIDSSFITFIKPDNTKDSIFIKFYDTNYNITKIINFSFNKPVVCYQDYVENNQYYGLGCFEDLQSLFFITSPISKLENADIKNFTTSPNVIFAPSSFTSNINNDGFSIFHFHGISEIDLNLELSEYHSLSDVGVAHDGNILKLHSKRYVVFGISQMFLNGDIVNELRTVLLDSAYNMIEIDTLENSGKHFDYPGIHKSIDTTQSYIYVAAMHPTFFSSTDTSHNEIIVAKYDYNLNKKWEKVYGGDANYLIGGITALSNEQGCLVYGYTTDPVSLIRYPYILYIDSNGILTNISNPKKDTLNCLDVRLLTNPVINSQLNLIIKQPSERMLLHLISPEGRKVYCTELNNQKEFSYRVNHLPSGMYYYILYDYVDNCTIKGKWIKQ